MVKEDCSCKKKHCERHGNCDAVKHITQSLNESARVKEKRMLFIRLSIELIESTKFQFVQLISKKSVIEHIYIGEITNAGFY